MYFWDVNAVVKDLKAGLVSEGEKAKYLFAFGVLNIIFGCSYLTIPVLLISLIVLHVGLLYWGIRHCYIKNKEGDGKDFLSRFVCIGWPATIRFMCFSILVIGAIGLLMFYSGKFVVRSKFEKEWVAFLFSTLVLFIRIFYYRYVGSKIASVAKG